MSGLPPEFFDDANLPEQERLHLDRDGQLHLDGEPVADNDLSEVIADKKFQLDELRRLVVEPTPTPRPRGSSVPVPRLLDLVAVVTPTLTRAEQVEIVLRAVLRGRTT